MIPERKVILKRLEVLHKRIVNPLIYKTKFKNSSRSTYWSMYCKLLFLSHPHVMILTYLSKVRAPNPEFGLSHICEFGCAKIRL